MCEKDAHTKQGIIISERIKSLEEKPLDISRKLNIITETPSSKKGNEYNDKIMY